MGQKDDPANSFRRRRRRSPGNSRRLGVGPSRLGESPSILRFERGQLGPAGRFRKILARLRRHVRQSESGFRNDRLHRNHLLGQTQRPGDRPFRGIDRQHFSIPLKIGRSKRLAPRQQGLKPRCRTAACFSVQETVGRFQPWGKSGRPHRRGVFRNRLAQPAARMPRRDNNQRVRKVQWTRPLPISCQELHRLRQQRAVPRQKMAPDSREPTWQKYAWRRAPSHGPPRSCERPLT